MIIIPAIDLYQNQVVRLHKGNFDKKSVYSDDPIAQAKSFEDAGATHLHLVDIEAAKKGDLVHLNVLENIKLSTNLNIDFGGGIRSVQSGIDALNAGADQINVGTMAAKSPGEFEALISKAGAQKIILSADRDGEILKTHGWLQDAGISFWEFIENYIRMGGEYVTSTDISKDGTLSGVDLEGYRKVWMKYPQLKIVVSGGVGVESDVLPFIDTPVHGIIIGKALYENKLDLKTLIDQTYHAS